MSDSLARHRAVIPNWVALYYNEPIEIVSGKGSRVTDARAAATSTSSPASSPTCSATTSPRCARRSSGRSRPGSAHLHALPDPQPGRARREDRQALRHPGRQGVLHQLRHRGQRDRAAARARYTRKTNQVLAMRQLLPRPHLRHGRASRATRWKSELRSSRSAPTTCTAPTGTSPPSASCPTRTTSRPASTTCATARRPSPAATWRALIAEPIQGVGGFTMAPDGLFAAYKEVLRRARHPVHLRRGADRLGPHRRELLGHPGARRHAGLHDVRQGPRQRLRDRRRRRPRRRCMDGLHGERPSPPSAATRSPPPAPTPPWTTSSTTTCRRTRPPAGALIIDGPQAGRRATSTIVADVRGKGLMFAVELADPATGSPAGARRQAMEETKTARPAGRARAACTARRCAWPRR